MNIKEDIKYQISKSGKTMKEIVDALNSKNGTDYSLSNFSRKLTNGTIRFSEVIEIADIIGKRIAWEDKPSNVLELKKLIDEGKANKSEIDELDELYLGLETSNWIKETIGKYIEEKYKNKQS